MFDVHKLYRNSIVSGSLSDIPKSGFTFTDAYVTRDTDLSLLAKSSGIDVDVLKDSLDMDLRPQVTEYSDCTRFVLKASYKKGHHYSVRNFSLFISSKNNAVILLRDKNLDFLDHFKKLLDSDASIVKNQSLFVFRLFDMVFSSFFNALDAVEDGVDKLEEIVFDKKDKVQLPRIFSLKKSLIYFHKALVANREVISVIEKRLVSCFIEEDVFMFKELDRDCSQLLDEVSTYRELLTGALDIHLSISSIELNDVMKVLSSAAAIIMIPTLISGIYGMNFKNMPELVHPFGYYYTLFGMLVCSVILYIILKRKKWI